MLDKSELVAHVAQGGNLSAEEVARFDSMADQWWDPNGQYKTALAFNQARMSYIVPAIEQHFSLKSGQNWSNAALSVLDVGCGGGLISEPLAKLGAAVTGIDASGVSIHVAKQHAQKEQVLVDYQHRLSSELDPKDKRYDVVINAEVVEHVPDQEQLIRECCNLVKPGGLLILATLNRTWLAWLIAIVGAEYVLRLLPIGTHDWDKFVAPQTLINWSKKHGFEYLSGTGMTLNPMTGKWRETRSMRVNYLLCLAAPK